MSGVPGGVTAPPDTSFVGGAPHQYDGHTLSPLSVKGGGEEGGPQMNKEPCCIPADTVGTIPYHVLFSFPLKKGEEMTAAFRMVG